jgi:hypothetical protein
MKKLLLFPLIIASGLCNAATGNASDGDLALISIIALLLLPVAAAYLFHFFKIRIHDIRTKRIFRKHLVEHNGEL